MAAAAAPAAIPLGFRFSPSDWEMIAYLESLIVMADDDQNHLKKDIVYYNFIRWATLYDMKPWELFNDVHLDDSYDDEEGCHDLYLLTPLKKKTQNGSRIDRTVTTTASSGNHDKEVIGTWKLQTGQTDITDYKTGKPLGMKRAATFVPAPTDNKDQDAGTSSSCSSSGNNKRKKAPEEMQGISYIMHEYTLCPSDDQEYSLCRIRRKIDKKTMTMIKKKKMRRSSSPERTAGYDHHQQEVLNNSVSELIPPYEENNICYNDGQQQQQQEAVVPAQRDVQISNNVKRSIQEIEELLFAEEEVAAPAAATGGEEYNIFHNDIGRQQQHQQQQEAVLLPPEGDNVQISVDDKGLSNEMEDIVFGGVILDEEFLSRLEQEVISRNINNKWGLLT